MSSPWRPVVRTAWVTSREARPKHQGVKLIQSDEKDKLQAIAPVISEEKEMSRSNPKNSLHNKRLKLGRRCAESAPNLRRFLCSFVQPLELLCESRHDRRFSMRHRQLDKFPDGAAAGCLVRPATTGFPRRFRGNSHASGKRSSNDSEDRCSRIDQFYEHIQVILPSARFPQDCIHREDLFFGLRMA